jgi:hypothetical protein
MEPVGGLDEQTRQLGNNRFLTPPKPCPTPAHTVPCVSLEVPARATHAYIGKDHPHHSDFKAVGSSVAQGKQVQRSIPAILSDARIMPEWGYVTPPASPTRVTRRQLAQQLRFKAPTTTSGAPHHQAVVTNSQHNAAKACPLEAQPQLPLARRGLPRTVTSTAKALHQVDRQQQQLEQQRQQLKRKTAENEMDSQSTLTEEMAENNVDSNDDALLDSEPWDAGAHPWAEVLDLQSKFTIPTEDLSQHCLSEAHHSLDSFDGDMLALDEHSRDSSWTSQSSHVDESSLDSLHDTSGVDWTGSSLIPLQALPLLGSESFSPSIVGALEATTASSLRVTACTDEGAVQADQEADKLEFDTRDVIVAAVLCSLLPDKVDTAVHVV